MKTKPLNYNNLINPFGLLIIFDLNQNCVAISENCVEWFNEDSRLLLNKKIQYFNHFIKSDSFTKLEEAFFKTPFPKHKVTLHDQVFCLDTYQFENHIYFELEKDIEKDIEISHLTDFQQDLDNSDDIWQTLCNIFYDIFEFDKISIHKFKDQAEVSMIAEKNEGNLEFESTPINSELNALYKKQSTLSNNSLSQIIDVNQEPTQIVFNNSKITKFKKPYIKSISKKDIEFSPKNEAKTSICFSIVIENRLWGVVSCHHKTQKHISQNQKSAALFIINYASSRYLINKQNFLFFQKEFIKDIELEIKERVLLNENLEQTIGFLSPRLLKLLSAEGLILKSSKSTFTFGNTPDSEELKKIESYIDLSNKQHLVFYSDQLNASVSKDYSTIARLNLKTIEPSFLYFFKRNKFIEEIHSKNNNISSLNFPPHTDFEIWEKIIKKITPRWSKFEVEYLNNLNKLINESLENHSSKITELKNKLDEANTKLETYTYQIGHDILSPLTTIKISAEFIQSNTTISEENIRNYTDTILDAGRLINNIIAQTIQNTSHNLENSGIANIKVDTFIQHIIDQAVAKYNIENFDLKLGALLDIKGEKTLLYQLFLNLINNSIKFSSKQKITKLEIYSEEEDHYIVYYIKDNGIGISKEDQEKIFDIFERSSNSSEYEGLGVGMSIVKRITEQLNIKLLFKSKIDAGTTFILKFPKILHFS